MKTTQIPKIKRSRVKVSAFELFCMKCKKIMISRTIKESEHVERKHISWCARPENKKRDTKWEAQ